MLKRKCIWILMALMIFLTISSWYYINHYPVVISVHGANALLAKDIEKHYRADLGRLAWLIKERKLLKNSLKEKLISKSIVSITHSMKYKYALKGIHLTPIIYPNDESVYITVDILNETTTAVSNDFKLSIADPDHLINLWDEYEEIGYLYFKKHGDFPAYKTCPVNHCVFGFDLPALQRYETLFHQLVVKDKHRLIAMLTLDKDSHKRAVAAFLLAHLDNFNEVITILLPAINDPDPVVRNNVLRVLGFIFMNHKNVNISIEPFKSILNSPLVTDRNKALLVLLGLSKNKHEKFIQYFGGPLYAELQQKQPNNHNLSYAILQTVSGKSYRHDDYAAWRAWLLKNNASISS